LLGVDDALLISQCEFKLDENGELTILTLTSPEAYTLNSTKLIKSNAQQRSNPYISG
jgi:prophage tail gpP-like protein